MANYNGVHTTLINHLLEEKDRLIFEKDELSASKDRLWREMYEMVRGNDVKIEKLMGEHPRKRRYPSLEHERAEKMEALRGENKNLKKGNKALEETLRDMLEKEEEQEEGEDHDVEVVEVVTKRDLPNAAAMGGDLVELENGVEFDLPHKTDPDDMDFGRRFSDNLPSPPSSSSLQRQ